MMCVLPLYDGMVVNSIGKRLDVNYSFYVL